MVGINNELQKRKILWSNPNPADSFTPQKINLSSDDYDVYEIFYALDTSNINDLLSQCSIKGKNCIMTGMRGTGTTSPYRVRNCKYDSDTSLSFDNAYYGVNALTGINNSNIIPLYVIGYKTGLFKTPQSSNN